MSDDRKWEVKLFREQFYGLRYRVGKGTVDFEIHMLASTDYNGGTIVYQDGRNSDSCKVFENPSSEPVEGGHVMHGFLRFDGCINIQQTDTDCMMHFCDFDAEIPALVHALSEIAKLGQKMGDVWGGHRTEETRE